MTRLGTIRFRPHIAVLFLSVLFLILPAVTARGL